MKLTKLMLSAFVAALALVSCNKENTTPTGGNLKSIEVSLENVEFVTKGPGITENLDKKDLKLNTIQLFFTDGTSLYKPLTADGKSEAVTYMDAADATPENLAFHYLPAAVNKVIAVANHDVINATSLASLNTDIDISKQVDPYDLVLYAESAITQKKSPDHSAAPNGHETDVYTVNLLLAPRVARFEIKSFQCNFSNPALYNTVEIHQVSFADFYQYNNLSTNRNSTLRSVDMTSQTTIFGFLNSQADQDWDNDLFKDANLITLSASSTEAAKADVNLAYNFFPAVDAYPRMVLRVTTNGNTPGYLATTKFFMLDGTELKASDFRAGYIYRIESFAFADTDLTHQDRCVEITLSVAQWNVITVVPSFK